MKRNPLAALIRRLRRWFRRDPHDPWSRVREPVRKGPRDRSGSVALQEPDN